MSLLGALGDAYRRHADQIPDLQAVVGANTSFVNTHFTAAQDAIDVAFGHALGNLEQKVVHALPGGLVADFKHYRRIFSQVLHFQYNDHLVSRSVTACPMARSGIGGAGNGALVAEADALAGLGENEDSAITARQSEHNSIRYLPR